MIKLIPENQWEEDLKLVEQFITTYPKKLSQGEMVELLEHEFAEWIGSKYALYCNSGSSANELMVYCLKEMGMLKNRKVILPALSWATTVSPWMHYDFDVIFCDASQDNLGMDLRHFGQLIEEHKPAAVMPVHVLGMPCFVDTIADMCDVFKAVMIEDACESMGSKYKDKTLGTHGIMGSFSCFVGHHLSTIEGGFVVTNDEKINTMLRMLRAHGWNRDIANDPNYQSLDPFQDKYNFYVPGFNMRGQEINAYMGLKRLEGLAAACQRRKELFDHYQEKIKFRYWKPVADGFVSAMAYPVVNFYKREIVADLEAAGIESRPLIAGSMEYQPFVVRRNGFKEQCHFASNVHKYGFYIPLHPEMTFEDVDRIADIINEERKCRPFELL